MINKSRWQILLLAALFLVLSGGVANSQHSQKPPGSIGKKGSQVNSTYQRDMRRRLAELDRLLALRSLSRAESLLTDLRKHSILAREMVPRLIKLAQLKGKHEEAVELCREALSNQPELPSLWRSLMTSELKLGHTDLARQSADRYLNANQEKRSAATVAVEMFFSQGYYQIAVAMIDSLRTTLPNTRFMGRQKAFGLLETGFPEAAADEVSSELRHNPFNLSLMRMGLLQGRYSTTVHKAFRDQLIKRCKDPKARSAESILVANLLLAEANSTAALVQIEPLLLTKQSATELIQNANALSRELRSIYDLGVLEATVDYLLAVLSDLSAAGSAAGSLRMQSADYLAGVCEDALKLGLLGSDPEMAVERFGELLAQVRVVNPASERLYSSQISLANYTRDVLKNPDKAVRRLERMLLDLDLPSEGVALVRLTLGECYLAAGDTARGRVVLTKLGRDTEFRQASGHAHYHLARLDMAEGHLATARDRFAVIALDNPAAPYSNDALEMGLAVAEEMTNPSGGPDILNRYARSVYFDLVAKPDSQLVALENFITSAEILLDLEEPQHLLERANFELAAIYQKSGNIQQALDLWAKLAVQFPAGRYPAAALYERGLALHLLGRYREAEQSWQQVLAQYPDYLFIDDVRDQLRTLP